MRRSVVRFLQCALLTTFASASLMAPAQAGSLFVFQGPEANVEGQSFASAAPSGLTVKVSGSVLGGTAAENANANAYLTPRGLGVLNGNVANDRSAFFNSIHVDGLNPEFLTLEFSDIVRIEKVFFHNAGAGSTDTFGLVIDGVTVNVPSVFGSNRIADLAPTGQAPGWVPFPTQLAAGRRFDFVAANFNAGSMIFDEWNLEKVEAEVIPEMSPFLLSAILCMPCFAVWLVQRRLGYQRVSSPTSAP